MSDVPTAGSRITVDAYINETAQDSVAANIKSVQSALSQNANDIEDAEFLLNSRSMDYRNQRASFESWIQTRTATASDDQNPEVVARVQEIEQLKLAERQAERAIETLRQEAVQQNRRLAELETQRREIRDAAYAPY